MEIISEVEIKLRPSAQTKVILERALVGNSNTASVDELIALLGLANYLIESSGSRTIRDEYYDTKLLEFHARGASCRVRHVGDTQELTVKWRKAQPVTAGRGLFEREERTQKLTHKEYLALVETGMLPASWEAFEPLENRRLILICEVANSRRDFQMKRKKELYQLSVDRCSFSDLRESFRRNEDFLEVEIEAENMPAQIGSKELRDKLAEISRLHGKFEFSSASKYSQAVHELGIGKSIFIKGLIRKSQDAGIAIGLVALVVGFPLAMGYFVLSGVIAVLLLGLYLFYSYKKH